jgi:hypothetical protein
MILADIIRLAQDVDTIEAETVASDTQDAVETLQTLQSQLEDVSVYPLTYQSH